MFRETRDTHQRESVAVIGSGVSGLTAAYVLARSHDVTLFEADHRLGGHAHTHVIDTADGPVCVDSGFIVHNNHNYPNLTRLFDELDVRTQSTEMSMNISCSSCGLSYSGGRGANGIFSQRRRVADPRFLYKLTEIKRFHREARQLIASDAVSPTWREFLAEGEFSDYFVDHFANPLVSCVWSSGEEDTGLYPAKHLFQFLDNHGMLSVGGSPDWRTVTGGSHKYVNAVASNLIDAGATIRTSAPITAIVRRADGVEVRQGESTARFDRVVVATHADQALKLLADADESERRDLAAIRYSRDRTVLHSDSSLLPETRTRSGWNHRATCRTGSRRRQAQVSYWMNRLMRLDADRDFIVTLNCQSEIDPASVIAEMEYTHPIFTHEAVSAAERLRGGGGPRLAFAGAHLGWGFHEDGCRSGAEAARKFGATW